MVEIAFIGLGNMGAPMAANLLKAGYRLCVFDLNQGAVAEAKAAGAIAFPTARDATRDARIIVTMLPNGAIVRDIYEGPEGVLDGLASDSLLIDCSTTAPGEAVHLAAAARARDLIMIDAPVSGGVRGAREASLSFMVGGEAAAFRRAEPILQAMGKSIFHVGANGTGQAAKICNNMMAAILMAGTAEVLALGARNGLEPAVLSDIMRKSSGGNFMVERWNPWPGVDQASPASHGFAGGFQVALMLKDLGLAIESAQASKAAVPIGAATRNMFQLHALGAADHMGLDMSSIQRLYYPGVDAAAAVEPVRKRGN